MLKLYDSMLNTLYKYLYKKRKGMMKEQKEKRNHGKKRNNRK